MEDPEFDPEADIIDLELYRSGGNCFSESELAVLGDLTDKRVLVTPEGSAEETLSFINLGADVTVLGEDFDVLRSACQELDLAPQMIQGGLASRLPDELEPESFDIVYSPWGSLDGVDEFSDWAVDVATLLKQFGRLIVFDEHPVSFMVKPADGQLTVATSYWGEFVDDDSDGEPDSDPPTTFGWAIGDLVTALGNAGVATLKLEEFEESGRYLSGLELFEEVDDEIRSRLPSALLLVAVKL
ncbi:MAG: hypothetical protein ABI577_17345 [bacterium]